MQLDLLESNILLGRKSENKPELSAEKKQANKNFMQWDLKENKMNVASKHQARTSYK